MGYGATTVKRHYQMIEFWGNPSLRYSDIDFPSLYPMPISQLSWYPLKAPGFEINTEIDRFVWSQVANSLNDMQGGHRENPVTPSIY